MHSSEALIDERSRDLLGVGKHELTYLATTTKCPISCHVSRFMGCHFGRLAAMHSGQSCGPLQTLGFAGA